MNCNKAQRLYDDLADGRVSEPLAAELRRHLDECTDCRVLRQRAGRLQQLLSLKRHEQPAPAYFDNFLGDFHRRLAIETMRPTWRERLAEAFRIEIAPAWQYGLAGACALVLAVGFFQYGSNDTLAPVRPTRSHSSSPNTLASVRPAGAPVAWQASSSRPQYVLERLAVTPVSYETASIRF